MDEQTDFLYLFPTSVRRGSAGELALAWPEGRGPFGQRDALSLNPALTSIQWRAGVLSAEECARVVALGERLPHAEGDVEQGTRSYRVSHIAWIEPAADTHWLFHRLAVLFAEINAHYGFGLTGFVDALQYTVYGPGQHFDWHVDVGADRTSARKLSMTLHLSGPGDYTGGSLEFINAPIGDAVRELGSATFFPSYLAHRVAPVGGGTRRSLVAWAYGPAFR
jgi:PKHD-type hydroxylase